MVQRYEQILNFASFSLIIYHRDVICVFSQTEPKTKRFLYHYCDCKIIKCGEESHLLEPIWELARAK